MRTAVYLSVLASLGVLGCAASAAPVQIVVHTDQRGARVSPLLYGIFFEEINMAGDGGLYAELVRNRSFEDNTNRPQFWNVQITPSDAARVRLDEANPYSAWDRHSLRVHIPAGTAGSVSLANSGYWGIPLTAGADYRLRVIARGADGFTGPVQVRLEGAQGRRLASAEISGLTSKWHEFQLKLRSSGTDMNGRLLLNISQPGTVWFDYVSLFPVATWKGRPNGLRPDLAEMLRNLKPAFVRFPGGSWIEGDTVATSYRWKQTIGPVAQRRTQHDLWGYEATQGLGFEEYLQLCEDLGAEPLFVINCGMALHQNVPLNQMSDWVQDALDALQYANGPVTSKWGARRAEDGHPAPFHLDLVEIGNENGGPAYAQRWALFYRAIKARYPNVKLIADVWGGYPTNPPPDLIDEHYYSGPDFFYANADRYDHYNRHGPKVYVGEYAVTQHNGHGALRGALAEAAFMTGLERNADVVSMASYAPLFANVHHRTWSPDAINFDNHRAYGTPSYYVQAMFAHNRADVDLPTDVILPPVVERTEHGAVGVGTWATEAEFKDFQLTHQGAPLAVPDLTAGLNRSQFTQLRGDWQVKDGALRQTERTTDRRAVFGNADWSNYTFRLEARKLGGAEGFLIMFHVRDSNNYSWWNVGGWGNTLDAIEVARGGSKSRLGRSLPRHIETGRWYDLRVEVQADRVRCFLDNQLVHDVRYPHLRPLYIVAGRINKTHEIVLKAVNREPHALPADLQLEGATGPLRGTVTVLTASDPSAENSLADPNHVLPVTTVFSSAHTTFHYEFPAHSLTILRVHTMNR